MRRARWRRLIKVLEFPNKLDMFVCPATCIDDHGTGPSLSLLILCTFYFFLFTLLGD